ncbi:hypothetical protein BC938DRAFT_480946 [Jimgerdemannia flammicorona]|uniref:Dynamin N-terminal domain-containing protein n=1 Tax=Jimgerdemannia flammicorona TaxID=994334 RepID=A0A433QHA5_9FUNG|nr:hypothetical protein BC938DRAFT_480946 [Jimgerdemannia flammicorona]
MDPIFALITVSKIAVKALESYKSHNAKYPVLLRSAQELQDLIQILASSSSAGIVMDIYLQSQLPDLTALFEKIKRLADNRQRASKMASVAQVIGFQDDGVDDLRLELETKQRLLKETLDRLLPLSPHPMRDEEDLANLIANSTPNGYIDGLELQYSTICKARFERIFNLRTLACHKLCEGIFNKRTLEQNAKGESSIGFEFRYLESQQLLSHYQGRIWTVGNAESTIARLEKLNQMPNGGRHGPDEIKNYIKYHGLGKNNKIPRLAIVGNMKSGKSTFVNALIGSDNLLLMRSQAATTIPTICRHSPGTKVPKLTYEEEPFQLALHKIRMIMDEMEAVDTPNGAKEIAFKVGVAKIEADAECFLCFKKIKDAELKLPQSPGSFEECRQALVLLNDIMRIYIHLLDVSPLDSSSDSPLLALSDNWPTVEIEFHFIGGEDTNLEIVDSPGLTIAFYLHIKINIRIMLSLGPDEITSGELESIVKDLVKTCDACFSVLDCTDLAGGAEEKLKYLLNQWDVKVGNLYVIANQADELSKKGEEEPEKIRNQIASRFLGSENQITKVYMVSARKGRLSRNMKKLIDARGPDEKGIPQLEVNGWQAEWLQHVGPKTIRTYNRYYDKNPGKLVAINDETWRKSGIEKVENFIIDNLIPYYIAGSLHHLLDSIQKCNATLSELQSDGVTLTRRRDNFTQLQKSLKMVADRWIEDATAIWNDITTLISGEFDNLQGKAKNIIKITLDKFWEQAPNDSKVPSKRTYGFVSFEEAGENVDRMIRGVRLAVETLYNDFRRNLQTLIDQMLKKHEQNLSESLKSTDPYLWNNVPELIPRFTVSPKVFEPVKIPLVTNDIEAYIERRKVKFVPGFLKFGTIETNYSVSEKKLKDSCEESLVTKFRDNNCKYVIEGVIEEGKKQQESFVAGWREKQDEYAAALQSIQNDIDQKKLTDEYARDIVAVKLETYSISVNLKNYASVLRTITPNVKSA